MPTEIHTRAGRPYRSQAVGLPAIDVARMQRDAGLPRHVWRRTLAIGGYPVGALDGLAAARPSQGLPRYTSNSAHWPALSPHGGFSECAKCRSLGSISPTVVRSAKTDETPVLEVRNYLTSAGRLDPTRMSAAMGGTLTGLGYAIQQPEVSVYPLTWAWAYDGPNKVYQAKVVGTASGPFVRAMDGIGPTTAQSPTAEDSKNLPSVGTVISFKNTQVPQDADLNELLGQLRSAKVTAARGSNATDSGQLELILTSKPKTARKMVWIGLAAAVGLLFLGRDHNVGSLYG